MTKPTYIPKFSLDFITKLLAEIPWERRTEVRSECFMSDPIREYTYGKGRGARTYKSIPYHGLVEYYVNHTNSFYKCSFNACFLNRYDNEREHLGWHSDDSPGQDFDHPIAVITFGAEREIWWRPKGQKGEVPADQRQLLESGSIWFMPAGFQQTHEHRIPKHDRPCGERVSLTLRKFL